MKSAPMVFVFRPAIPVADLQIVKCVIPVQEVAKAVELMKLALPGNAPKTVHKIRIVMSAKSVEMVFA